MKRVVALALLMCFAPAVRAQTPPLPPQLGSQVNGWTSVRPGPDSRLIYLSATGSDSNPGTQDAPKKTLGAGREMLRPGMPDQLLLKCGDTWNESFGSIRAGGRSLAEPLVIGSYGAGERPLIRSGTDDGITLDNYEHGPAGAQGFVVIQGIAFTPSGYDGKSSSPTAFTLRGNWHDVLLEDVYAEKYCSNVVLVSNEGEIRNVTIRRCVIVDAYRVGPSDKSGQGVYIDGTDTLLMEECVLDHNGWSETVPGAMPTIYRRNVYIQGHAGEANDCRNVTTRGCIIARGGSDGMQQRPGGLAEDHLFLQNPIGLIFGTRGGTINRCVVLDSVDLDRNRLWGGEPQPRMVGFNLVDASPGATTVLNDCICMYRTTPASDNVGAYAPDSVSSVTLNRCIAWSWKDEAGHGNALDVRNSPQPKLNECNLQGKRGACAPREARSITTYATSQGWDPTLAGALAECRKQSRQNWRPACAARGINDYIRAGWAPAAP